MKERFPTILAFLVVVNIIGFIIVSNVNAQSVVCEIMQGARAAKNTYALGESVNLTFAVRNPCDRTVTYKFSSAMQYDLWVKRGETEIYRLSRGRYYAAVVTSFELKPGELKTFDVEWNQKDNQGKSVGPGVYDIYAQLTPTTNAPPAVKTKVQIGRTSMAVAPVTVREAIRLVDGLRDRKVQISGTYRGSQPNPDDPNTKSGPPVTRSDWAICDNTGCMYVNGTTGLNPDKDMGTKITVTGRLAKTKNGQVYIISENVTMEQPNQAAPQATTQITTH